jgi:hypothetical protein
MVDECKNRTMTVLKILFQKLLRNSNVFTKDFNSFFHRIYIHTHTHTHTHIYIHTYINTHYQFSSFSLEHRASTTFSC